MFRELVRDSLSAGRPARAALTALGAVALLVACSGSTGPTGPAGPAGATGATGATGPAGGVEALDVSTATAITGTVKSVTIGGPPVVQFSLVDENGVPLKGLTGANIGWAIAKLTPGVNGESSTWQNYFYDTATPSGCPSGVPACLTKPVNQEGVERGTAGTLVDNGDGTYQYTFQKDITTDPIVTYNAALTHRIGFFIEGLAPANNGSYTWQPSTGATTGIFSREIIELQTCDGCHTQLSHHGGLMVETQFCVVCHNPSNSDPYSGNTLDFKRMIHKIHQGNSLASIQTPPGLTVTGGSSYNAGSDITPTLDQGYWIVGYMQSLSNFNTVLFPQDTRNCTTCHNQNLPAATEAANYMTVPTIEACGACHDTVNFATGAGHLGGVQTDAQCSTCHANASLASLEVPAVHVIPDRAAAANFQFVINSVTVNNVSGSLYPVVNFKVVNPANNNAPYDILQTTGSLAAAPFAGADPNNGGVMVCSNDKARLYIDFAWETSDYTNWGSAATPAPTTWGQPIQLNALAVGACATNVPVGGVSGPDATGSFTLTSPVPLPPAPAANCPPPSGPACAPIQNFSVIMEGHPAANITPLPTFLTPVPVPETDGIAVTSQVAYGNTAGTTPVPRRTVVSIAKCDTCHNFLSLHGGNRNDNPQVCVNCHNPASTDVSERQLLTTPGIDGLWEQSINFRYMIHSIHAGMARAAAGAPFYIYGYGVSYPPFGFPPTNFTEVVFPGQLNDCAMCHNSGTYYPVNDATVQAATFDTGLESTGGGHVDATTPGNPISTSANMAVCESCHVDSLTASHMMQMGGSTDVLKDAEGRTIPGTAVETCALCHGPGALADVAVVHNIPVADR